MTKILSFRTSFKNLNIFAKIVSLSFKKNKRPPRGSLKLKIQPPTPVIPAQAGIQLFYRELVAKKLGPLLSQG
jgi:energy-converting hydrogenase Eha subunit A